MKKMVLNVVACIFLISNAAFAAGDDTKEAYTAKVNGIWLKNEIYENKDHAHMMPVREICDLADLEVRWDADKKMVTVVSDEKEVQFVIGEDCYVVNGTEEVQLKAVPEIKNDYSYVPSPFFSQLFGFTMKNETNEVIDITFEEKGNEEIKVVEGVIEDATMNTLKIKTKDGKIYCFDTSDADKSGCNGMLLGSSIIVSYQVGTVLGNEVFKAVKLEQINRE
ncbi:MAG: copper amine oxidase N-terminal domain-containing protein [Clostridiales bacterium]|nr:copper amine oxidase N-terminal domain-containing protein [Clostridiales bacterium]